MIIKKYGAICSEKNPHLPEAVDEQSDRKRTERIASNGNMNANAEGPRVCAQQESKNFHSRSTCVIIRWLTDRQTFFVGFFSSFFFGPQPKIMHILVRYPISSMGEHFEHQIRCENELLRRVWQRDIFGVFFGF